MGYVVAMEKLDSMRYGSNNKLNLWQGQVISLIKIEKISFRGLFHNQNIEQS